MFTYVLKASAQIAIRGQVQLQQQVVMSPGGGNSAEQVEVPGVTVMQIPDVQVSSRTLERRTNIDCQQ